MVALVKLFFFVSPVAGLQGLLPAVRPALLHTLCPVCRAVRRRAPSAMKTPRRTGRPAMRRCWTCKGRTSTFEEANWAASMNEEADECVISEAGSSCISAGVPRRGVTPPVDEERRRRSPGLMNNFYDISTHKISHSQC